MHPFHLLNIAEYSLILQVKQSDLAASVMVVTYPLLIGLSFSHWSGLGFQNSKTPSDRQRIPHSRYWLSDSATDRINKRRVAFRQSVVLLKGLLLKIEKNKQNKTKNKSKWFWLAHESTTHTCILVQSGVSICKRFFFYETVNIKKKISNFKT